MSEPLRLVGGPMDGQTTDSTADVIQLAEAPGMAYHRTIDPAWVPDERWWMEGRPEPAPPERYYEWHEWEWVPPHIRFLRDTIREAADRVR